MKILVTGGAGYVGSHCVRGLCDADHEVVVYDDLRAGHREAVDKRATLVEAGLADLPVLEKTVKGAGFEAVMHFAASLDVGESVKHPLDYYENNMVNTVRLLRVMEQHQITKFVFSSTCAIYGIPESVPITEVMSQSPINPYGHTKLAMEWAMRDSAVGWGLGCCALRYFNAAGAASDGTLGEDHDPELHLIPIVLQVALGQREKVRIYGVDYPTHDGTCVRDYTHVEDLASAHLLAIESQQTGCFRCFNVGTGVGSTVKDILEAAREVTGHPIPAKPAPRRPGDPPELYADPTEIMSKLGWKPKYTDIRQTVRTAWQWHQAHPHGFQSE
ncbi:MAG: UDP-glucose 4-epimerase GalE [Phycisphaerae bacterium]|nr:UDP-glucose 4-epimerase GalE [Phycisphaerae bacterium]